MVGQAHQPRRRHHVRCGDRARGVLEAHALGRVGGRRPQCGELWKPTVSSIRSADLNRLLSVKGTVIRTGQVKMLHSERMYRCQKCGGDFKVFADMAARHQMAMPPECAAENLGPSCSLNTPFSFAKASCPQTHANERK